MKKVLSILLVMGLLLLFSGAAFAGENIQFDSQSSDVFVSFTSGIGLISGKIQAEAYSSTWGMYDQTIHMELQKEGDSGWETIKSWERSDYTGSMSILGSYPAEEGKYRVMSTHIAGGEEPKTSYSGIKEID